MLTIMPRTSVSTLRSISEDVSPATNILYYLHTKFRPRYRRTRRQCSSSTGCPRTSLGAGGGRSRPPPATLLRRRRRNGRSLPLRSQRRNHRVPRACLPRYARVRNKLYTLAVRRLKTAHHQQPPHGVSRFPQALRLHCQSCLPRPRIL